MCFSATASFTAAALLAAAGAATWRMARCTAERPLAAMPLLFAAQQVSEGALWLGFGAGRATGTPVLSYVFYARWFISVWCFFAAVLSAVVDLHFAARTQARWPKVAWTGGPSR